MSESFRRFASFRFSNRLLIPLQVLLPVLALIASPVSAQVVINEIDYDQDSTDDAEFVELKNNGGSPVDLDNFTLELVNGASGGAAVYNSIDLPPVMLAAGGYFVICANAATVANCDLDGSPNTNFIQNGSPDAVGLKDTGTLVDAVSYEGEVVAPYFEGAGVSLGDANANDGLGISRFADGSDTDDNNTDFSLRCITPGTSNSSENSNCVDDPPTVTSTSPTSGEVDVAVDSNVVITFSEDVTAPDAAFSISCDGGAHTFVSSGGPSMFTLNPNTDFDAVEQCTVTILAAQVADQDGNADNMLADAVFSFSTPGFVVELPDILINEVDADTPGSDALEFIELFDGGVGNTDLTGLTLVAFNGSDNRSYNFGGFSNAVDLDGFSTDAEGYFVIGNAAVANVDLVMNGSSLQNGADAIALYIGNGSDFPNDTDITLNNILDAMVYDTNDSDDAALLVLLNGGQPQVNENGEGDDDNHSNQRCSNGAGGARNTNTYIQVEPTPGAVNDCPLPFINEVDADTAGSDSLEFVELYDGGSGNLPLDGLILVRYNGSDDKSTGTGFDLDGFSTNGDGYFVIGNAGVANVGLVVPNNTFQNGADAVALFMGNEDDFPNDTPLTTVNLIDALVYDTNDSDDAALLTLMNPGQPQLNEDAGTDSTVDSNQRCPNGFGGERNSDSYVLAPPTPGANNTCPALEIFEIQGSSFSSIYDGFSVRTEDNIVTAVGPDGFFMQTPEVRDDADVNTSNGIFVFTGGLPTVSVGDQVDVTGGVTEFFDFTQFSFGSSVSVDSSGNTLPAVMLFDGTVPSPNPMAPSCLIEFECYEGMLVQITGGTVTGSNQRFNTDPIAEVHITAAGARTYREPGIEFPGLVGFPEWDGNPEVFELDPDKLGLANQTIPAGSHFDATGVIGFEFGGYELWPSSLSVTPAVLPQAVRTREVAEMTVGALNLFRLFNDVNDGNGDPSISTAEYDRRLTKLSAFVRDVMDAPDVLAVSEVESLSVLQDLADEITMDDGSIIYTPYLEEGNDIGGIDVGFLALDTVVVDNVTQLGLSEILTFDGSLLNDRPPLLLEGRQVADGSDFPIAVIAIHGRSLSGIDTSQRVRQKRLEQAQYVAQQVQLLQVANPDINLVIAGDFNAYEFSDSYADVTGHMKGDFIASDNLICDTNPCTDHVSPDLISQVAMIDPGERYSFVFRGNAQALDQALTSSGLDELVNDFQIARGNSDAAVDLINDDSTVLRSSDHDGLVLYLIKDSDGDGVTDNLDLCPATVIPESAPTKELRINNFALVDDDRVFDTKDPEGVGPMQSFDIFDTAGCSCEQIVVEQGLGKGHLMFGCSIGEMEIWVDLVTQP
jgi:endonuclease/exonuclease/phosphatase family metal-dependent hydrolase